MAWTLQRLDEDRRRRRLRLLAELAGSRTARELSTPRPIPAGRVRIVPADRRRPVG